MATKEQSTGSDEYPAQPIKILKTNSAAILKYKTSRFWAFNPQPLALTAPPKPKYLTALGSQVNHCFYSLRV